jgi:hypothetical protein
MQMDVWGAEVYGIIAAADQALWAQEQQLLQLQQQQQAGSNGTAGSDCQQAAETAAALLASMQGALQDAAGNVQRLYDKRYQQVEVRWMPLLTVMDVADGTEQSCFVNSVLR